MDLSHIPQTVPEICVISPSPQLADNVRKLCAEKGKNNVGVFIAVLDEGLRVGRVLQERGAKVLVSRKGTAALLDMHLDIQVVKINTTMNDYLRHIDLMRQHKGRIGIVEYDSFIPELKKLCQYIGIPNALLYGYRDSRHYEEVVMEAVHGEATILLGGGALLPDIARRENIPHTIVENTQESIEIALDTAQQLLNVQQEEEKKQVYYRLLSQRYSTVLEFTHDAVLAVDRKGLITVANPIALKLLSLSAEQCLGRAVQEMCPQLNFPKLAAQQSQEINQILHLGGTLVSANKIPILIGNCFEGAVFTFQNVKDIQKTEQKIRLQLHQKGHVAKYNFQDIIGSSPAITRSKEIAQRYAKSGSSVLITGETGVGKELFAQSIHANSTRANGPFVAINCASLGKELLESQLFGYEEGAFTGAARGGRPGLFEVAHGGTIFLDEIGEIPVETQTQLLRVLQEKEVRRVGGHKIIPVDVRVICATNRNLIREVEGGRFRRDLFYRINILRLDIPPLRSRTEDIPQISRHFLNRFSPSNAEAVMDELDPLFPRIAGYHWPGNVRELMALIERTATLWEHGWGLELHSIILEDMAPGAISPSGNKEETTQKKPGRDAVLQALRECGYVRNQAAKRLGISRSTLWRYLKEYGLEDVSGQEVETQVDKT